jgi:hypothetical protein
MLYFCYLPAKVSQQVSFNAQHRNCCSRTTRYPNQRISKNAKGRKKFAFFFSMAQKKISGFVL